MNSVDISPVNLKTLIGNLKYARERADVHKNHDAIQNMIGYLVIYFTHHNPKTFRDMDTEVVKCMTLLIQVDYKFRSDSFMVGPFDQFKQLIGKFEKDVSTQEQITVNCTLTPEMIESVKAKMSAMGLFSLTAVRELIEAGQQNKATIGGAGGSNGSTTNPSAQDIITTTATSCSPAINVGAFTSPISHQPTNNMLGPQLGGSLVEQQQPDAFLYSVNLTKKMADVCGGTYQLAPSAAQEETLSRKGRGRPRKNPSEKATRPYKKKTVDGSVADKDAPRVKRKYVRKAEKDQLAKQLEQQHIRAQVNALTAQVVAGPQYAQQNDYALFGNPIHSSMQPGAHPNENPVMQNGVGSAMHPNLHTPMNADSQTGAYYKIQTGIKTELPYPQPYAPPPHAPPSYYPPPQYPMPPPPYNFGPDPYHWPYFHIMHPVPSNPPYDHRAQFNNGIQNL